MTRALVLALLLAACGDDPMVFVRVDGRDIIVEGDRNLRALHVEVALESAAEVAFTSGADTARLNVLAVESVGADGHVGLVLSDTRKLLIPARGAALRYAGASESSLRLVHATAVDASGASVAVGLR